MGEVTSLYSCSTLRFSLSVDGMMVIWALQKHFFGCLLRLYFWNRKPFRWKQIPCTITMCFCRHMPAKTSCKLLGVLSFLFYILNLIILSHFYDRKIPRDQKSLRSRSETWTQCTLRKSSTFGVLFQIPRAKAVSLSYFGSHNDFSQVLQHRQMKFLWDQSCIRVENH